MIETTEHIFESLDHAYETTEDHTMTDADRVQMKKHSGVDDYREYFVHDGLDKIHGQKTILQVYKYKGAYEIHHKLGNGESGKIVHQGKSAARFISTIFDHAKKLVDKGHAVRIVGPKHGKLFHHYRKIATHIANKHDFIVGKTSEYHNTLGTPEAHDFHEFKIGKHLKEECLEFTIHDGSRCGPTKFISKILMELYNKEANI